MNFYLTRRTLGNESGSILDDELPDFIFAMRTDAIYNAHGYLTKVPVDGILPHLNALLPGRYHRRPSQVWHDGGCREDR
jgi:hypothetical protein